MKYRANPNDVWRSLSLSTSSADYTASAGLLAFEAVADGKGVFVRKSVPGADKVALTELTLRLAAPLPKGDYEFAAFGVEMVYIPEAAFYVGDSASVRSLGADSLGKPFLISSENAVPVGQGAGQLFGNYQYRPSQAIQAAFPKGYGAFYAMKYELSQQQYAVFLNHLTYNQQKARTTVSPDSPAGTLALTAGKADRSAIVVKTSGSDQSRPAVYGLNANPDNPIDSPDDAQTRACNHLSYADLAAYLDWAALRPMSELEFEKAARGTGFPEKKDYPWGTALETDARTPLNDGTENETVSDKLGANAGMANSGGLANDPFLWGPLRNGFAATDSSSRQSMGASYYGVAELSGNVWEPCVSVVEPGHWFDGKNGDGELTETGAANVENWPNAQAEGMILRGGGWNSLVRNYLSYAFRDLAVSDRFYATTWSAGRRNTQGGRGCRTAE